jgi:hypothetical protein
LCGAYKCCRYSGQKCPATLKISVIKDAEGTRTIIHSLCNTHTCSPLQSKNSNVYSNDGINDDIIDITTEMKELVQEQALANNSKTSIEIANDVLEQMKAKHGTIID